MVVDAFRRLPEGLGAKLVLLGEGPLRTEIAALGDERIVMPGYVKIRAELARWLASADIYASGMADETSGVSIVAWTTSLVNVAMRIVRALCGDGEPSVRRK